MPTASNEMNEQVALVVTTIASPNDSLRALAHGCQTKGYRFIAIGDEASPKDFDLDGCHFFGLQEQYETGLRFARLCPTHHYARKNLGYLIAIRNGATVIAETDDDNLPYDEFWNSLERKQSVPGIANGGWTNVYRYFSESNIWPRGLPLDHIKDELPAFESLSMESVDCPIQQALADDDPDVDAIYRLISGQREFFRKDRRIALQTGSWCPFNSQNTTWWRDAFALMYLPAFCSFRMTDIWRSFVAQRIAWTNDWAILFREPNVQQARNAHNLLRDFADEVPGYLNNAPIGEALSALSLPPGIDRINDNLRTCYERLVSIGVLLPQELDLLEAWLGDLEQVVR
jgi:hypothetical protein